MADNKRSMMKTQVRDLVTGSDGSRLPRLLSAALDKAPIEEVEELKAFAPSLFPVWPFAREKASYEPKSVIGAMKQVFRDAGLTKAGWKFVLAQEPANVYAMMRNVESLDVAALRLQHFARLGLVPADWGRLQPVHDLHLFDHGYPEPVAEAFCDVVRAMVVAPQVEPEQAREVLDWLDETRPLLEGEQRKKSWQDFVDTAHAHFMQQAAVVDDGPATEWQSLVPACEIGSSTGPYEVVPICDSASLKEEGEAMHHCVGGYSRKCERGTSRIFGIRRNGARVATLELTKSKNDVGDHLWVVAQVRGPCNAAVDPDVHEVTRAVRQEYEMQESFGALLDGQGLGATVEVDNDDIRDDFDYVSMTV